MAADVGQGTTIELTGIGTFDAISLDVPELSITPHDVTKLSDTVKQSLPGRTTTIGMVKARGFVGDVETPTQGWEGTAVVTLPIPDGMTSARVYTYTGFVSRVGGFTVENDGVMSFDFDFTCNAVVVTDEA